MPDSDFSTDALLLQFVAEAASAKHMAKTLHRQLQTLLPASTLGPVARSAEGMVYAYITLPQPQRLDAAQHDQLQKIACEIQADAAVSRLEQVMHLQSPTSTPPQAHYVVEMDPETGWKQELFDWYDTEHLPGLASVPGTQQAWRYLNHDHGPLSLACYHLSSEAVLGCPAWLAVRGTAWSSRVRPHFTNTKRTMFTLL